MASVTTRHGVTRKEEDKEKKPIGKPIIKSPKIKGDYLLYILSHLDYK